MTASPATIVPAPPAHVPDVSSTGLSPRVAAVLCYAAAWASGLLLLAIERDSRFVRFHAWQSVLAFGTLTALALGCWGLTILMAFASPAAFRVMAWVTQAAWLLLIATWLVAIVQVSQGKHWAQGKRWKLPLVGTRAERLSATLSAPR